MPSRQTEVRQAARQAEVVEEAYEEEEVAAPPPRTASRGNTRPNPIRRTAARQVDPPMMMDGEMVDPPAAMPNRNNAPPAGRRYTPPQVPNGNPLPQEIDTWLDHSADGGDYYNGAGGYGGCGPNCGPGCGCGGGGGFQNAFCGGMGGCRPSVYARGEYLYYWTQGQDLPALVTTSTAGTARADAGIIGLANTTVLYGNNTVNDGGRSGVRGTIGFWIGDCFALEGDYLNLGDVNDNFAIASDAVGQPTIARPFFNAQTNTGDAALVAFNLNNNAVFSGNLSIDTSSSFESAGMLLRKVAQTESNGCRSMSLDYLFGFRYARLKDRISFNSTRTTLERGGAAPLNSVLEISESFSTDNRFAGADFGMAMHGRQGCWTMDLTGKLGIGSVARQVDIYGQTIVTANGQALLTPGGLLAQRSNIGRYRNDDFAFMPEVNIRLGLDITCRMRLTAGYNFMAITGVARSAEQIDSTVNLSQVGNQPLAGAARPTFNLIDSDFWAHGISAGLEGEF